MSSNPTQPKLGDQAEGVNFPPEDDAEGHRAFAVDGDAPEGMHLRGAEGDGRPEGFLAMADSEDDTEGHRIAAFGEGDGQPDGGPENKRLVMADGDEDDTEGHRVINYAGDDRDGPDGLRSL